MEGTDMNTFNNQHVIINSMNDQVINEFFDYTKLFLPECLSSLPSYASSSPTIHHQIVPQTNNNNVMMNQGQVLANKQLNSTNLCSSYHYPSPEFMSQKIASSSTSSSPQIISFGNPTSATLDYGEKYYCGYTNNPMVVYPEISHEPKKLSLNLTDTPNIQNNLDFLEGDLGYNRRKTSPTRKTPQQAQCHVEAERKRREKLSSLFISLSKVVPGLKKLDKVSVLEDAIKHMKELQERLRVLEEEAMKKNSRTSLGDDNDAMTETCITSTCTYQNDISSLTETFNDNNGTMELQMPDIKVKILGRNVLIKILCDKKYYGCALNMSNELQKLHLTILDTRVLHFGGCAIDVTFAAQMESQFSSTVNGIIEHLQIAKFQVQK